MRKINNKGFTLVELLVVILLISVVAIISSDMVISLTATSTKIQNKLSLEEDYSFLNLKLTKLIQDADFITFNNSTNTLIINHSDNSYHLSHENNSLKMGVGGVSSTTPPLITSEVILEPGVSFFRIERTENPQVVYLNFKISRDSTNERLKTETIFEKRITVNKTYQE